jgi:hypothetical protein
MFARRTCVRCGKVLPLAETTGGRPSKFCGAACRVAAHRARSAAGFVTVPGSSSTAPHPAIRTRNETRGRAPDGAGQASKSASSLLRTGIGRTSTDHLKMAWKAPGGTRIAVRPDPIWPGMFRVHHGARITDMVNISRARDAAQALAGEQP